MSRRKKQKSSSPRGKKTRTCRSCGKKFNAILDVWYCSGQCERLAANPVAKFARQFVRHAIHRDKTKYNRKRNKVIWNLEHEG